MNRLAHQLFPEAKSSRFYKLELQLFISGSQYLPPLDVNLIRGSIIVIRIVTQSNEKMVRAVKINTKHPTIERYFEARTEKTMATFYPYQGRRRLVLLSKLPCDNTPLTIDAGIPETKGKP